MEPGRDYFITVIRSQTPAPEEPTGDIRNRRVRFNGYIGLGSSSQPQHRMYRFHDYDTDRILMIRTFDKIEYIPTDETNETKKSSITRPMAGGRRSKKTRKSSKKTRKSRKGAMIQATSLNEVRNIVKNELPDKFTLLLMSTGTRPDEKYGFQDDSVSIEQFKPGKGPAVLEKLIKKYKLTDESLRKDFTLPGKESEKGKYYFMY